MKILFIVPYPPGQAASQRFRFEQYFDLLKTKGISYDVEPFLDRKTWNILYGKRRFAGKIWGLIKGATRRFLLLFKVMQYEYVFLHREAAPVGPPVIEWIISKWFRRKIILDFDDAIWIPNSSRSNRFFAPLKYHGNVFKVASWAYKVSVGNHYLMEAVKPYNDRVVYNPTTIDTKSHHNRIKNGYGEVLTIGWTGSHSTIKYLNDLVDVIQRLAEKYTFRFVVISDAAPEFDLPSLEYIPWNKVTEIDDLFQLDIGLMPLTHDPWSEGKCGFKALQYLALGIPAVVSPVGVNAEIVTHGVNGYHCHGPEEWYERLSELLGDREMLKKLSGQSRKVVIDGYSVESNSSNFIHLFS